MTSRHETDRSAKLVWFGLVWFGLVWFGLVWLGLAWLSVVFPLEFNRVLLTCSDSIPTSRQNQRIDISKDNISVCHRTAYFN